MSKDYYLEYAEATMHRFKTHIAHYVRLLESGLCKGVIVKRGKKPVGVFIRYPDQQQFDRAARKLARNKNR